MKKIMFNDKYQLTKAVLEGRKTMTRRLITDIDRETMFYELFLDDKQEKSDWNRLIDISSKYKIGEIVAIAQSYYNIYEELKRTHGSSSYITRQFFHKYIQGGRMPVSNKMFVASEACTHRIRITDIKVERLQDISIEDCLKEGIKEVRHPFVKEANNVYVCQGIEGFYTHPKDCFAELIDKVSGKGTWQSNPWVFAYTFELVD